MVFLNVNLEVQDAVASIATLTKAGFTGAVQLMSSRGSAVLDNVKQAGEQMKLPMLPVLKKPFETSAIQKVLSELKLGHGPAPSGVKITLAEALKNNWVEFWYQPKIDLRRKQLAGAEAFARVCHPEHGVLLPGSFMPGADDASVNTLAERALVSALQSGLNLSRNGVNLRIVYGGAVRRVAFCTAVPPAIFVRFRPVAAGVAADDLGPEPCEMAAVNTRDEAAAEKHDAQRFGSQRR